MALFRLTKIDFVVYDLLTPTGGLLFLGTTNRRILLGTRHTTKQINYKGTELA
jgi:hypothetical protein